MTLTVLTEQWLQNFKQELLAEVRNLAGNQQIIQPRLKSAEVKAILRCKDSKLASLRNGGKLPWTQIEGTYYYKADDVEKLLNGEISS